MAPGYITTALYNEQYFNRLNVGVNGIDPRSNIGGMKRKSDVFLDVGTNGFMKTDQENDDQSLSQDLSMSSLYPRRYLSVFDNYPNSPWQLPGLLNKIKRTKSMPESSFNGHALVDGENVGIHRRNSTNSLPKLRFRDHVWTYTQRYLEAEAIENAISDYGALEDEGTRDGMHLVQLLVSCAEAVACRDKTQASKLLAELRGDALVFGSSFQRVASCFMQGLTDRLSLVHPLGAVGLVAPARNLNPIALDKKEEALRLVYETCPHIKF
ncbi:transcription factor GRAS, partial [Tanacetum coccineum]